MCVKGTRAHGEHTFIVSNEGLNHGRDVGVGGEQHHRRYAWPGWNTQTMTEPIRTYAVQIALAVTLVVTFAASPAAAAVDDAVTHSLADASAQTIGNSLATDADPGPGRDAGTDGSSGDENSGSRYPPFSPPP